MNSLSALANLGTPPASPARSRRGSEGNVHQAQPRSGLSQSPDNASANIASLDEKLEGAMASERAGRSGISPANAPPSGHDEKTPLLAQSNGAFEQTKPRKRWLYPKRVLDGVVGGVAVLLSPIVYTGQYLVACFYYEEDGRFSLAAPLYHMTRVVRGPRRKKTASRTMRAPGSSEANEKGRRGSRRLSVTQSQTRKLARRSPSIVSTSTAITSDSEIESERPRTRDEDMDFPSRHTRSKSNASSTTEEIAPAKRSIRIKLHNEDALRQRKKAQSNSQVSAEAANALKSPTGPLIAAAKHKFPRAPHPPRPLVPRRQPSYSAKGASAVGPHQKTLILDLDETLIHSMAKGGRFQTGHMVEVKLQASVGAGGQIIGPQVPILYYVHKRPFCDEFLKKISKWYNLIIFTASVQEYADPVIDWLEVERKYFAGRYYRQHCTFRNGAYIKDLAQVEPDLSKVMILDNSPMSYIFHEDNAIPIEGWISDPTDYELLHLIPLLEGLQYVTDVRALLALRQGMPSSA
ncbi:NLI interacting factor-like phosphatase-domain-containing protein [Boeremia exigua]|uniref:NLI interacting factor-like phosphatase-domain-containing protein n=1 Tax=Boeremia exigua TaxID=749465 RepID=UPI001E8D02A6|nr:NLI interacting factor-like phosphatase-domain-containing protein [Boeremia exigua]KAH6639523.1 NLI interacting factor-like phosphatase-domain-containing protein [Boeremia exigua]